MAKPVSFFLSMEEEARKTGGTTQYFAFYGWIESPRGREATYEDMMLRSSTLTDE